MSSSSPEEYFEVSCQADPGICSDNDCPCGFPGTAIARGTGYMFVSPQVVAFRSDAKTEAEAMEKITRDHGVVADPNAIASPILMCEMAADRRGIDKEQAASVARHWWETGAVPLSPTRLVGTDPVPPATAAPSPVETALVQRVPLSVEDPVSTRDAWLARLPDELDEAMADSNHDAALVTLIQRHGVRIANLRFTSDFPFESLRGATLLELMVALRRTGAVEALVAVGAQPRLLNGEGVSALDLARGDGALLRLLGG